MIRVLFRVLLVLGYGNAQNLGVALVTIDRIGIQGSYSYWCRSLRVEVFISLTLGVVVIKVLSIGLINISNSGFFECCLLLKTKILVENAHFSFF